MWDMRRSIDPGAFPERRVVVQFEYPDAPNGARDWWLIAEAGEIDLCLEDPGHEIDLLIRCPLVVMTSVWTCQRPFNDAVKKGEIRVMGDPGLGKNLQQWLCSSLLSRLGSLDGVPGVSWPARI